MAIKIISLEYSPPANAPESKRVRMFAFNLSEFLSLSSHRADFSHFSASSVQKIWWKSGKVGRIYATRW